MCACGICLLTLTLNVNSVKETISPAFRTKSMLPLITSLRVITLLTVCFPYSFDDLVTARLDKAYREACKEGTKKVYNARIILAGYSGGGKTSLANRLLGEQINVDERHSTEGIELHRIESKFNRNEMKGEKWTERSINPSDLERPFFHEVWSRSENLEDYSNKSNINDNYKPVEDNEQQDCYHSEEKRKKIHTDDPSDPITRQASNEQTTSEETLDEMKNNMYIRLEPESEESTPCTISVWDLGGQNEFISTHHLFLNVEAFVLVVMDITKGLHELVGGNMELGYLNTPAEFLHYWINHFYTVAKQSSKKPNIAIVLTHTDLIKGRSDKNVYINGYIGRIIEMIRDKPYAEYIKRDKIYTVSNATDDDSDFQKLRDQLLKHFTEQDSWGHDMPVTWLKLKADIIKKAKRQKQKSICIWIKSGNLVMS